MSGSKAPSVGQTVRWVARRGDGELHSGRASRAEALRFYQPRHPRQKHLIIERLGQEVARSQTDGLLHVSGLVAGGKHHGRYTGQVAQITHVAEHAKAVELGLLRRALADALRFLAYGGDPVFERSLGRL